MGMFPSAAEATDEDDNDGTSVLAIEVADESAVDDAFKACSWSLLAATLLRKLGVVRLGAPDNEPTGELAPTPTLTPNER